MFRRARLDPAVIKEISDISDRCSDVASSVQFELTEEEAKELESEEYSENFESEYEITLTSGN